MSFSVSKIVKFPQLPLQIPRENSSESSHTTEQSVIGGTLSDSNHCWLARGGTLEVKNIKTGRNVGSWTFGNILKDSSTKIVCVDELLKPHGRLSILVVGLNCTISGGLVCIFEVFCSKVIRAIQVKNPITSLHVVDSGLDNLNLPGPLRNFDGILAVGSSGGDVYLIDVCRQICEEVLHKTDVSVVKDELCPSQMILLTAREISNIDYYKKVSIRDGDHLAIHLNVVLDNITEHFILKGPKDDDRVHVNKEEVAVSAVYYCPQLTSLLVGYNFGAFQLWNLTNLLLTYTSPICEDHTPITHFAVQEPADDPRAFCYIWVSYSAAELFQSGLPFVVMFGFSYENKEYHEGYGYLYQNFKSAAARFQVDLGAVTDGKIKRKIMGGYCMGLQPISKTTANKEFGPDDAPSDTLVLCMISWTIWFSSNETQTCLLVFDLNQWYKEELPSRPSNHNNSSYMLRTNLTDVLENAGHKGPVVFDVKLNKKTLKQFIGTQKLEEHFHPSSLSFDVICLREMDVIVVHDESLQRTLLDQMEAAGPLCLLRPSDFYSQIVALGLSPLFVDVPHAMSSPIEQQRSVLLDVCLEQKLIGWLCNCASEWANGSFSSAGCSLDFLLNWAFERAVVLKKHCDDFCTHLFDYSQIKLDSNATSLLNNCTRQLNNLNSLFTFVLRKLESFLTNFEVVVEQHTILQTISIYFEVLQWLVNVGLLPECHQSAYPRLDENERISAPYPVQQLTDFYQEKRVLLQQLNRRGTFPGSDSLLFIDNLIINKCGAEALQRQWQEDGGSGLYPPPSLQSLLRTYLVKSSDINYKHSLVIYVFLDLAMALDQNRYSHVVTHLIKFPAVFKVTSSIIKITQAFWQLDHGDYTTALEQLLDPFVLSEDLEPWHHSVALRALLLQDQHKFALLYMQVRKPPITSEKDIITAISLFIANNMLDEAFYFQKHYQSPADNHLLLHLFNECNKHDSLKHLLYKTLDSHEEKSLFKYFQSLKDPGADDLQVFYHLLRSRFVEAFDTHDCFKKRKPENQGLIGQRSATRSDQVVKIFKNLLPDVNKNIVNIVRSERMNLFREVVKPTPLSVFVHNNAERVQYKSTVIHAVLAKSRQTFADNDGLNELGTEDIPFLRTPSSALSVSVRNATPKITPRVIEIDLLEGGPSPSKRLKLTPRQAISSSPLVNRSVSFQQMSTPIIKRKSPNSLSRSVNLDNVVETPQSILKVRTPLDRPDNPAHNDSMMFETSLASPRLSFRLTPRKSLSKSTPNRPNVHFDDSQVSSSVTASPTNFDINSPNIQETIASKESSLSSSSFYSPDSSFNQSKPENEIILDEIQEETLKEPSEEPEKLPDVSVSLSPKPRRSYNKKLVESPVRFSPRLSAKTTSSASSSPSPRANVTERVRGRKSLSRQVLESNAFAAILPVSKEKVYSFRETTTVTEVSPEKTQKTTTETSLKVEDSFSKDPQTPVGSLKHVETSSTKKILYSVEDSYTTDSSFESDDVILKAPETATDYDPNYSRKSFGLSEFSDSDVSLNISPYKGPALPQCIIDYFKNNRKESNDDDDNDEEKDVGEEDIEIDKDANDECVEETNEVVEDIVAKQDQNDHLVMDVYEDLSSGDEDIKEVFEEEMRREQEEASKVYEDLSNTSPIVYNLQEAVSSGLNENSDGDLNKFLNTEHEPEEIHPKSKEDVIEIDSSSSNDSSVSCSDHKETSDSNSSNIHVAYEPNIYMDEAASNGSSYQSDDVANAAMLEESGSATIQELSSDKSDSNNDGNMNEAIVEEVDDEQTVEKPVGRDEVVIEDITELPQAGTSKEAVEPLVVGVIEEVDEEPEIIAETSLGVVESDIEVAFSEVFYESPALGDILGVVNEDSTEIDLKIVEEPVKEEPAPPRKRVTRSSSLNQSSSSSFDITPRLTRSKSMCKSPVVFLKRLEDSKSNNEQVDEASPLKQSQTSIDKIKTNPRKRSRRSDSGSTIDLLPNFPEEEMFPVTPALKKSQSGGEKLKVYAKRTRRNTVDVEENVFDKTVLPKTPAIRRTRSVSVDEVRTYQRKTLVDPVEKTNVHTKASLPTISEENPTGYLASRRLTRLQSSLFKGWSKRTTSGSEKQPLLESIDPINLLEKSSFQGNPDPDEQAVYESSASNSSISSSPQKRRNTRAASVTSESSISAKPTTKRTRKPSSEVEHPMPLGGIKTRLRTTSLDASLLEKTLVQSPRKVGRKKSESLEEESNNSRVVGGTRRTRSASVRSDTSDSSRKSSRSRRAVAIDLPEIAEEKTSETALGEDEMKPKRSTRNTKK